MHGFMAHDEQLFGQTQLEKEIGIDQKTNFAGMRVVAYGGGGNRISYYGRSQFKDCVEQSMILRQLAQVVALIEGVLHYMMALVENTR